MPLRNSGWGLGWRRIRTSSNISTDSYNGPVVKSPTKSMQEAEGPIDIDNGEDVWLITSINRLFKEKQDPKI